MVKRQYQESRELVLPRDSPTNSNRADGRFGKRPSSVRSARSVQRLGEPQQSLHLETK